ncbi:MAG: ATP-binding response regulator [Terriglobales bacterium]
MASAITTNREPLNILLVDDQPARLLSYETVLAGLGENLVRANSGREALELLLKLPFAVVLVDVVMPELDGFELAAMIRAHPRCRRTAIIFISGIMVEDAYRLRGYDLGAVDYVSVPVIPEILRAKVAIFAELYRKSAELEQLNAELEARVAERTAASDAARREAEQANLLKDEFLATLSHELRTPLNAITGWTHLLAGGQLDATEQRQAVEVIQRNAFAQARLMADLLDVSRILAGKLRLELQPAKLAAAVDAALTALHPLLESRHITLHYDNQPDLPPLRADPVRLQQIAANLVSNAAKFAAPSGEVRVSIRAAGDRQVQLQVTDDGAGIPDHFLPFVFDRFRQNDSSSTRGQRGLGLGLAIVRHLAEAHGGTVEAANRSEGHGACFTVTFPVPQVASPPAVAPEPDGPCEPAERVRGLRLLVVEDDADAREMLARLFEREGAEVVVAASAAEALLIVERRLPDVMISDIEMPGEDGYSLVARLRALPPDRGGHTPVVALTAYAGAQDRHKLLAAGFHEHLPKPVDALRLLRLVATLAPTRATGNAATNAG